MKNIIIFLLLWHCYTINAQSFTKGGATQIYWNWRPDIADSCYEFTFVNYIPMINAVANYPLHLNLLYWNECNYGKQYIGETDTSYSNIPLHDTLFRMTYFPGIVDTFCGFDAPYQIGVGVSGANALTTSPHRKKIVYTGLIYLPEKCKKWNFVIGTCDNVGKFFGDVHFYGNAPFGMNSRSNIDSFARHVCCGASNIGGIGTSLVGCSLNNYDFVGSSSPRATSQPMYYFANHKEVEYNPGIYDPDHDKLVINIADTIKGTILLNSIGSPIFSYLFNSGFFKLTDSIGNYQPEVFTVNCNFATRGPITGPNTLRYNSQNNPFDTDSTFHLVDSTGKTTFTAASEMEPILYYSIKKYRDEILVSENFFVNQFTLLNDSRPVSYLKIDTASLQNATFNNEGVMMSCLNLPISFDAYVKLPVTAANLIVRTTADSTLPGNGSCTVIGNHSDSVHLQFSWTVPSNARGLYNVYVSAKDSNCSSPYNHFLQVYTWSFYIDSCFALSVTNPAKENKIMLYPNPTNDRVSIVSDEEFSNIKIYDLLSAVVYEKKVASTKRLDISTADLPQGIYMVNIDGRYIRKLVVEK